MQIKLLIFCKGAQFATKQFKSLMREPKAFRADIFFKLDLENDLLTMTLPYNHLENKFNQLRHQENPTIDTKSVKIGPWTPIYATFALRLAVILDLAEKEG